MHWVGKTSPCILSILFVNPIWSLKKIVKLSRSVSISESSTVRIWTQILILFNFGALTGGVSSLSISQHSSSKLRAPNLKLIYDRLSKERPKFSFEKFLNSLPHSTVDFLLLKLMCNLSILFGITVIGVLTRAKSVQLSWDTLSRQNEGPMSFITIEVISCLLKTFNNFSYLSRGLSPVINWSKNVPLRITLQISLQ